MATLIQLGGLEIQSRLRANMLVATLASLPRKVEAQLVLCEHPFAHNRRAVAPIDPGAPRSANTEKLHPLTVILTGPGDATQAPGTAVRGHRDHHS